MFRFLVIDLTWGAYHAPAARAEVVQQMRTGVLVANLEERIVDWNQAAQVILQTPDLEGRTLRRVLAHAGAARNREIEIYEFPLERHGQRFGTGAVVADRTEMRRAELRLEMTTRIEALGYLTAGVAHEINNPLSYVSVNLTLARPADRRAAKPGTRRCRRRRAHRGSGGTDRRRARRRRAHPAHRGAHDAIWRRAASRARQRRCSTFATRSRRPSRSRAWARTVATSNSDVADELPRVRVAEMDVIQIVLHLLHNAAQMGGDDVPVSIRVRAERGGVAVRVEDGGPGIAEHDLPHVFEPLFTTRRPGAALGLGLSLCWELARRSGGTIDVENGPAKGAAFTLWLPAAPDEE